MIKSLYISQIIYINKIWKEKKQIQSVIELEVKQ